MGIEINVPNEPLISIITPAFNEEQFLPNCIESVERQNYDNTEHIIIDDGSTDRTKAILESTKLDHIKVYRQPNKGLPAAVNTGFDKAEGEIIVWLNADDALFKESTLKSVASSFKNTDADFLYGSMAIINKHNKINKIKVPVPYFDAGRLRRSSFGAFVFFRSTVTNEHKLDEKFQHVCDYEYYLRTSDDGFKFQYVDEILLAHRHHVNTKTNALWGEMQQESLVIKDKYDVKIGYKYHILRTIDRALENLLQIWGVVQLARIRPDRDVAFDIPSEPISKLLVRQSTTVVPGRLRNLLGKMIGVW